MFAAQYFENNVVEEVILQEGLETPSWNRFTKKLSTVLGTQPRLVEVRKKLEREFPIGSEFKTQEIKDKLLQLQTKDVSLLKTVASQPVKVLRYFMEVPRTQTKKSDNIYKIVSHAPFKYPLSGSSKVELAS